MRYEYSYIEILCVYNDSTELNDYLERGWEIAFKEARCWDPKKQTHYTRYHMGVKTDAEV